MLNRNQREYLKSVTGLTQAEAMEKNAARQRARLDMDSSGFLGKLAEMVRGYEDYSRRKALRDVLIEARHLCDAEGWDFVEIDEQAVGAYVEELVEAWDAEASR